MNTKAIIRKVLFAMLWISIGGGILTLLIAAIGKKNRELCSNYTISINSSHNNYFIDEKDITKLLTVAMGQELKGRKIAEFNLRQLEQLLEDNVWIMNAELWFDNRSVLHVLVTEREPIARIFTNTGATFYIDSNEVRMPLSDKVSARVPVFTNFPDKQMLSVKDSFLQHQVKNTAMYIINDPFWMSQVAQINISDQQDFEMIPVVGNHIVKLGNGGNMDKKFNRLMTFYKQVLSQTGFDAYSTVDVQYAGQVIGTKKGTEKFNADTAMFRQNAALLIKQIQLRQNETDVKGDSDFNAIDLNAAKTQKPIVKKDTLKTNQTSLRATSTHSTNPNNVKTVSLPKTINNKPKAVMPKKN